MTRPAPDERPVEPAPTGGPPGDDGPDAAPNRILRNAASIMVARAVGEVLRLFATLKAASYLGETEWGVFGYLLASLEVFRVLTNFGLDTAALHTVALKTRRPDDVVRHLVAVKLASSSLGLLAVIVGSFIIPGWEAHRFELVLLSLVLFPQSLNGTMTVRFQAAHAMERVIPVQFIGGIAYFAGMMAVAALDLGLRGVVSVYLGWGVLSLSMTFLMSRRTWPRERSPLSVLGLDLALCKRLFVQGVPLGLLEVIVILYSRLGVFLLESHGGMASVGQFYAAFKVSDPLLAIAGAVAVSAFPVLSRLAAQRAIGDLRRMFVRYSLGSLALSISVAVVVSLLAESILRLVKPEYAAATSALRALAWATVFMFQNQLSTMVINSFGKFHYVTGFACVNLAVYLTLGLWLVPKYGPLGAALATLGTEGFNTLMQLVAVAVMLRRSRENPVGT